MTGPDSTLSDHHRAFVKASEQLGQAMMKTADSTLEVAAETWATIARLATEVAVHAQALADRGEEV